jgi:hypothetical protein
MVLSVIMRRRKLDHSIPATLIGGLEYVLEALNEGNSLFTTARERLRFLVAEWEKVDRNLYQMLCKYPEIGSRLRQGLILYLDVSQDGNARFLIIPLDHILGDRPPVAEELFGLLVADSRSCRLGGPCDRCGRYYIKKRLDQKRYCGRRCAHLASATKATINRLRKERADRLRRANKAAQEWSGTRTKLDWKHWVSRDQPDITPKFLTRAVNKGKLCPPEVPAQSAQRRK